MNGGRTWPSWAVRWAAEATAEEGGASTVASAPAPARAMTSSYAAAPEETMIGQEERASEPITGGEEQLHLSDPPEMP